MRRNSRRGAVVDSLKVFDPKRPIREADIEMAPTDDQNDCSKGDVEAMLAQWAGLD